MDRVRRNVGPLHLPVLDIGVVERVTVAHIGHLVVRGDLAMPLLRVVAGLSNHAKQDDGDAAGILQQLADHPLVRLRALAAGRVVDGELDRHNVRLFGKHVAGETEGADVGPRRADARIHEIKCALREGAPPAGDELRAPLVLALRRARALCDRTTDHRDANGLAPVEPGEHLLEAGPIARDEPGPRSCLLERRHLRAAPERRGKFAHPRIRRPRGGSNQQPQNQTTAQLHRHHQNSP